MRGVTTHRRMHVPRPMYRVPSGWSIAEVSWRRDGVPRGDSQRCVMRGCVGAGYVALVDAPPEAVLHTIHLSGLAGFPGGR